MTVEPTLTLTDAPDPTLESVITANFRAYADSKGIGPSDAKPLAVQIERDGVLVGGLLARSARGWLHVQLVAIPLAERRQGLGTKLLGMAEEEAVRRGCIGVYLNTIQFQAPGFYEKRGYSEFARMENPDPALTRIWFRKTLG
jgi:GNAT superfamily N-acetyltransferase